MMPDILTNEIQAIEERKQRAARQEFVANNGNGSAPLTPFSMAGTV